MSTVYAVFKNNFFFGGAGLQVAGTVTDNSYGFPITYSAQGYYSEIEPGPYSEDFTNYPYQFSGFTVRFSGGYPGNVYLYETTALQTVTTVPPPALATVDDLSLPDGNGSHLYYPDTFYIQYDEPIEQLAVQAIDANKTEIPGPLTTPFTFTISRSGDISQAENVSFAVNGSGTTPAPPVDFAGGAYPNGTIAFAANQASQVITINVGSNYSSTQQSEGFSVTATAPNDISGSAVGTILNPLTHDEDGNAYPDGVQRASRTVLTADVDDTVLNQLTTIETAFRTIFGGTYTLIINSGTEGVHTPNSAHYVGGALDFAVPATITDDQRTALIAALKAALPTNFVVGMDYSTVDPSNPLFHHAGDPNKVIGATFGDGAFHVHIGDALGGQSSIIQPGTPIATNATSYSFTVTDPTNTYILDPSGSSSYVLTEDAASPTLASISIPDIPGVASFQVSSAQGSAWSAPQNITPQLVLQLPAGATSALVETLDANGNPTASDYPLLLDVNFATTGTFTGTLTGVTTISPLPVYRFFDTTYGTHLFTESLTEAQQIVASRPDLTEEANNFSAVDPTTDPTAESVFRLFETTNGTHFFTASTQEFLGLTTPGSATYRPDLTSEASSTFYEDSTQQPGEVAVYRLFDTTHGTQFLTGSQTEYQGLTTAGSSTYRADLTPEGIAFYAPSGNFSA